MENDYEDLRKIVDHNYKQLEKVGGDQSSAEGLITLTESGIEVYDPFVDTSLINKVDPVKEYGEAQIKAMLVEWDKR